MAMKTRRLVSLMARIRRDLQAYRPRGGPPPIPEFCSEAGATALLAELGRSYPPGELLSLDEIERAARACRIPLAHAARYRRWLQALERWPYADRTSRFGRPERRRA
jgi:hypothetical protein